MDVIEKRENDIKTAEPDVDTFMIQKFSENGVKNIFGKVKDEQLIDFPYIDVQIQTFIVGPKTFIVINGFTKGKLLSNGTRAQGQAII